MGYGQKAAWGKKKKKVNLAPDIGALLDSFQGSVDTGRRGVRGSKKLAIPGREKVHLHSLEPEI